MNTTPAKERDAAQIALARGIVYCIDSLNKTIAQANNIGMRVDLHLAGCNSTPEIREIYIVRGKNAKRLGPEVFYGK